MAGCTFAGEIFAEIVGLVGKCRRDQRHPGGKARHCHLHPRILIFAIRARFLQILSDQSNRLPGKGVGKIVENSEYIPAFC